MSGYSEEDLLRLLKHYSEAGGDLDALLALQRRLHTDQAKKEVLSAVGEYIDLLQRESEKNGEKLMFDKPTAPTEQRQSKAPWLSLALAFLAQFALTVVWVANIKATAESAKEQTARTEGRMDEVSKMAGQAAKDSAVNAAQIAAIDQRLGRIEQKLDRVLEAK